MKWLAALRTWARSDRIRSSPRDGKLLRLRPGACVRVGDTFAQVIARHARCDESNAGEVEYTCRAAVAEFHLQVRAGAAGLIRAVLTTDDGAIRDLESSEVETFARQ